MTSEYDKLETLFLAYLNEDMTEDYGTYIKAIDAFVEELTDEGVVAVRKELGEFTNTYSSRDEMSAALEEREWDLTEAANRPDEIFAYIIKKMALR